MTSLRLRTCSPMLVIRVHVDEGFFRMRITFWLMGNNEEIYAHMFWDPSGLCRDPGIFEDEFGIATDLLD